jgi:hypothetical protein
LAFGAAADVSDQCFKEGVGGFCQASGRSRQRWTCHQDNDFTEQPLLTRIQPDNSARLASAMTRSQHVYEVRSSNDKRGVDLISDVLPFGRLCYAGPNAISNAIGYANFYSRSHHAVIRVYDDAGNVNENARARRRF